MTEWVAIIQAGGTVGVLAIFGFLFWKGEIVAKGSLDKVAAVYESQVKILTNGFLSRLDASTDKNCASMDALSAALKEGVIESGRSRERMETVVREFGASLAAIEARQGAIIQNTSRSKPARRKIT